MLLWGSVIQEITRTSFVLSVRSNPARLFYGLRYGKPFVKKNLTLLQDVPNDADFLRRDSGLLTIRGGCEG